MGFSVGASSVGVNKVVMRVCEVGWVWVCVCVYVCVCVCMCASVLSYLRVCVCVCGRGFFLDQYQGPGSCPARDTPVHLSSQQRRHTCTHTHTHTHTHTSQSVLMAFLRRPSFALLNFLSMDFFCFHKHTHTHTHTYWHTHPPLLTFT